MIGNRFQLHDMTAADTDAAVALARAQGWRDRTRFYDFAFRTPTCQPLAGFVDGSLIATGTATANGPVGWLGAIAVAAEWRGRGFGRTMTEELSRRLRVAGCETMSLEATEVGRPMYERMGFRTVTTYHLLQAGNLSEPPEPPDDARVRPIEPSDLPRVFELDRQATAEDRSVLLSVLAGDGGWVLEDARGLRGFLLPAERSYGAIVAPRFDDGLFLLDLHRHIVPAGGSVRAGIPHEHEAAWRELATRGWEDAWRAPRMLLGPDVRWRPNWIWGQINSAMG